jgi:hypothetical protein
MMQKKRFKRSGDQKNNSLILFAAGFTGIFLVIRYTTRRPVRRGGRDRLNLSTKQTIKRNQP